MEQTILRPTAEQRYADELAALRRWDVGNPKPENWQLSPPGRPAVSSRNRKRTDPGGGRGAYIHSEKILWQ